MIKEIKKYDLFMSLNIVFILANSLDTDEMLFNVAFYLGLHCLPKLHEPVYWVATYTNGLTFSLLMETFVVC